jgi:hypothetical protein
MASDLVAMAVCEEYLRRDPASRLDIRVSGGQGALFVAGTVTSSADFDVSSVVRRTLAQLDPSLTPEPFISIEAPTKPFASAPVSAFGYATSETTSLFPPVVELAREAARELVRRLRTDAEWFWLYGDLEVVAEQRGEGPVLFVRAATTEGIARAEAINHITEALQGHTQAERILVELDAGVAAGLSQRVGSSGSAHASTVFGSALPPSGLSVGKELKCASVLGTALARAAARELVRAGAAKAAAVEIIWRDAESRPASVRARDEQGRDLTSLIDRERLDLASLPEAWLVPSVLSDLVAAPFDAARLPPWEV